MRSAFRKRDCLRSERKAIATSASPTLPPRRALLPKLARKRRQPAAAIQIVEAPVQGWQWPFLPWSRRRKRAPFSRQLCHLTFLFRETTEQRRDRIERHAKNQ